MSKINSNLLEKKNLIVIVLLLMAGVFYVLLWPEAPAKFFGDAYSYTWTAEILHSGKWDRPLDRVPGFPMLLILIGSGRTLYFVQLFFHLASIAFLLFLMQRLKVSPTRRILFALVALSPGVVSVLCAYVMTEAMAEFFLVSSFVLFVLWFEQRKYRLLIPASILLALSALIRPSYQLLFVPVAALVLLTPGIKRFRSAVIVAAISAILLGSYVGYNASRFGFYGITPLFGYNLSTRTVRVLERLPKSSMREILIRYRNDSLVNGVSHTGVMYIWKGYSPDLYWPTSPDEAKGKGTIPELMALTGLNKAELSKKLASENVRLILAAPLEYFREVAAAGMTFWFPESTEMAHFGSRKVQLFLGLIHAIVFSIFTIQLVFSFSTMALLIINSDLRRQFKTILPLNWEDFFILVLALVYVLYTFAISTLVEVGNPRYRAPVDLLIFFFVFTFSIRIISRTSQASKLTM